MTGSRSQRQLSCSGMHPTLYNGNLHTGREQAAKFNTGPFILSIATSLRKLQSSASWVYYTPSKTHKKCNLTIITNQSRKDSKHMHRGHFFFFLKTLCHIHSRRNVEFKLEGSAWNREEAQPYDLWLEQKKNRWCSPSSPYPNVRRLETDGLLNLSFNVENQVVETGFSSNRIPEGWSRRPQFCPSNLRRLPNRKVTHSGGWMG